MKIYFKTERNINQNTSVQAIIVIITNKLLFMIHENTLLKVFGFLALFYFYV